MRRHRLLRVIPLFAIAIGAVLLLTACPPPISPDLVTVVQDDLAPTVVISSPVNNSAFRSEITMTGTISDDSMVRGDGIGVLESITLEVGAAEWLNRSVFFGSGDPTFDPTDQEYEYGTFRYDEPDMEPDAFEITFSTVDPQQLTGFRQITLTAIDQKGHKTEEFITVYAYDDGPYVTLTSPVDGDRYESTVTIAGRVINRIGAEDDLQPTSEIDPEGLRYRIGSDTVNILPFDDRPATTEFYDAETGYFEIRHVLNPLPTGGVSLEVTATDLAGYEGSATRTLVDQARSGLEFSSPVPYVDDNYYYSSALDQTSEASIVVAGIPLEPTEIDNIVYDTDGGYAIAETDIGYAGEPTFGFSVDLSPATTGAGNVRINIRSYDDQGRLSSYKFTISDDEDRPAATGVRVGVNEYVELTFDEPVWTDLNRTGVPRIADFVTAAPEGSPLITSVVPVSGDDETGYTILRLYLSFADDDAPNAADTLTITPVGTGVALVDKANNRWAGSVDVDLVDQRPPEIDDIDIGTIMGAVSGSAEYVNAFDTVAFDVTFSEAVTIAGGTPRLHLDLDGDGYGDGRYANLTGGSGANYVFTYEVAPGDNTIINGAYLDYEATNLDLNGATVLDDSTLPLDTELPPSALTTNVAVDTAAPGAPALSLLMDATGGSPELSGNFVNATNTNVDATVSGVDTLTDPTLVGGWVELLGPDDPVSGAQTGTISGSTVNFSLLASGGATALQAALTEGPWSFTAQLYDRAGNPAPVTSGSASMTADYIPPGQPETDGVNADATGGTVVDTYVNSTNTNVAIVLTGVPVSGDNSALNGRAELFVDGSALTPNSYSGTITEGTVYFNMLAAPNASEVQTVLPEGADRVFRVQLTDQAGNVGDLSTEFATLGPDYTPPTIIDADSLRATAPHDSDTLEIEFSEDVDDSSATPGWFYMRHASASSYDVFSTPLYTDVTSVAIDSDADDEFVRLVLTPVNIVGTGDMEISIDGNAIRDTAGNGVGTVGWTAVDDEAPPIILQVFSLDYNTVDGDVERIEIEFSENVNDDSRTNGDFRMRNYGAANSDDFTSFDTQVNVIASVDVNHDQYIRLSLSPSNVSGTGEMQIAANAGAINDTNGNSIEAIDWADVSVTDRAAPRLRSGANLDTNNDGASETATLEFTEPIDDSSVLIWDLASVYYWHVSVALVSAGTQVSGDFTSNVTTVHADDPYTDVDDGTDDQYLRFSLTPDVTDVGTGDMDISFDANIFTDMAGNWNAAQSAIEINDYAQAVLMGARISSDPTSDNIYNENNDELRLRFSETLHGDSDNNGYQDFEVFFQFAGGTTDNNNFHSNVVDDRASDTTILRLHQNNSSGGSTSEISAGSTVAVVANTNSTAVLNDGNGLGVYEDATKTVTIGTTSFSIVPRGGGDTQAEDGRIGAGRQAGPASLQTLLPVGASRTDAAVSGFADEPYVAPAVARLANTTPAPEAMSTPVPTTMVTAEEALPMTTKVATREIKPAGEPPVENIPDVAGTVDTDARSERESSTQPVIAPADVADATGARSTTEPATPATAAAPAARSRVDGLTAVVAVVAILLLLAGAALLVLSRMTGKRARAEAGNEGSRAE